MGLARRDRGARRRRCGTSPTPSNDELVRNPHAPVGVRRRADICGVVPRSDIPDILARHALQLPARRAERDACYYSDRLLDFGTQSEIDFGGFTHTKTDDSDA
jgi:hypothetical protein